MQEACQKTNGTMAAILGLENKIVEDVCNEIDENVKPANYNCPGQLVISGEYNAVETACQILKERGAKRALILPVTNQVKNEVISLPMHTELSKRQITYITDTISSFFE